VVESSAWTGKYSLLKPFQTGTGTYPAYLMGTDLSIHGGKLDRYIRLINNGHLVAYQVLK
jgi:hypothetical protein